MAVDPTIANTLRDLSERIGEDFDASVQDFEHLRPVEPSDEPGPRPARLSALAAKVPVAALRRVAVVALFGGAATLVALYAAPILATWLESAPEQPAALAMQDPDAPSTQEFVVDGDTMYLEGTVPDQSTSDVLESAAIAVVGRDRVVNNFEISADAVYNPDQPIQLTVADPVLFRTGAARLDSQYRPLVDLAVDLMRAEPTSTLMVVGHTDDVGPEDANLRLSLLRANAVADLVEAHGIDRDRLTIEGRGESEPLESNDTREGRAVNRRVEFSIIGAFGR